MPESFPPTFRALLVTTLLITGFVTLYPMFSTGFGSPDDLRFYLLARNGNIRDFSDLFARLEGRFFFHFMIPVYCLPYAADSMAVVKLFHFLPLALCFFLFYRIIVRLTGSPVFGWFFVLLSMVSVQLSEFTSLFLTYPFYFTFSFALLLGALLLILDFYRFGGWWRIGVSTLLFALGLLFYETYLLFVLFAGLLLLHLNAARRDGWIAGVWRTVLHLSPYAAVAVLYLVVYFVYRSQHPPQYGGTQLAADPGSAAKFFSVLWYFSVSSFPMTIFETSRKLFQDKSMMTEGYSPVVLDIVLHARPEWIVKGVLAACLGFLLLMRLPAMKTRSLLAGAGIALLLIFLPHLPLAVTEKYSYYATTGKMFGYVTTFYSFFGTMILLTLLLGGFINLFDRSRFLKSVVAALFVPALFTGSVLTDFSNHTVATDVRSANLRMQAIDRLVKTNEFNAMPESTPIYGGHLWDNPSYTNYGLTEQSFNWYEYLQAKSGKIFPVYREEKEFIRYAKQVSEVPWYMTLRQAEKSDDVMIVMAELRPVKPADTALDLHADQAVVMYHSPYRIFTVSFRVRSDTAGTTVPMQVNHIRAGLPCYRRMEFTIYNTVKTQPVTIFTLRYPGIDLTSVMVSNLYNRDNPVFYL